MLICDDEWFWVEGRSEFVGPALLHQHSITRMKAGITNVAVTVSKSLLTRLAGVVTKREIWV